MKLCAGALAGVLSIACGRPSAPPPQGPEAPDARVDPVEAGSADAPDATPTTPTRLPDEASVAAVDLAPFATERPLSGKSVGHTSVVFKLTLEGGAQAAWKPRSKRGKDRYRGEIAAYRLAVALGLTNVPPALPRAFALAELRRALGDGTPAGKLLADEVTPDARGEVPGAIIPWIPDLRLLALDTEPLRSAWRGWLAPGGAIPEDRRALAAQTSTMLVFDYLTGNWDRWSGGNIGADASGQRVLYIDNDGAFFDPPPAKALAKQRELVAEDGKFSRGLVAGVRALTPAAARRAIGVVVPGEPLLTDRQLAGLDERRRAALVLIDARIAKDGEDKALAFE